MIKKILNFFIEYGWLIYLGIIVSHYHHGDFITVNIIGLPTILLMVIRDYSRK